jgi:1,4-dihydroxy-2-naphthoyl-CoA hydrolase
MAGETPMLALPQGLEPPVPLDRCLDAWLGMELVAEELPDGPLRARVPVTDAIRGRDGALHGGVFAAVAEALASRGTFMGVYSSGRLAMGLSNETSYVAPLADGHLNAVASPRVRGEEQWLWDVESYADDGRLCAVSHVTIAVRSAPDGAIQA